MKKNLLRLPHGTESLYLKEAYKHRKILNLMEDLTESWAYLPIQTPVFDFYDNYRTLLDHKLDEQTYKLTDREGELLMLRSDMTLFLARQIGMTLEEKNLPLRVFYGDSILKDLKKEDIDNHEFFQTGCELIGVPGLEGDLEMILLLAELLNSFKLEKTVIHIGSASLFKAIAQSLSEKDSNSLQLALNRRESNKIIEILDLYFNKDECLTLVQILLFIGTGSELKDSINNWKKNINTSVVDILESLIELHSHLILSKEFDKMFVFDFSETGNQAYYSGIVFSGYTENLGTTLVSGGRYDGLIDKFNNDSQNITPSIGFSLYLRKIEKLSHLSIDFPQKLTNQLGSCSPLDRKNIAREIRNLNKRSSS